MATPEQLAAIREQLRDELRSEVRNELRNETAAAAAAVPDAIRKKPEIPPFDKTHIDIWIRRMENAFVRANIQSASEKFAFLETKFPVGNDPKIDEFLYGAATNVTWIAFIAYLRKEYGVTKQQKASIFIDGFRRDGRRPSQFAAALNEKTKDVTLEDIKKEMLLREMPTDVRRMLQERIEALSFTDAAKVADHYFEADGRPKHTGPTPTVNQVTRTLSKTSIQSPTDTTDDEDQDVNAVGFRKKRFEKRPTARPQQGRNSAPPPQARNPAPSQQARNPAPPQPAQGPTGPSYRNRPTVKPNRLCHWHETWGDNAHTCKQGCPRFPKVPSNYKAGRQA